MVKKGDGNVVPGNLDLSSTEWGSHLYALNELTELRCVHGGLAEKRDVNFPEASGVDSSHEIVQVLARSSVLEACKSRENNAFF